MAQEVLNRNDMVSLIWDTANDNIKYKINAFGTIKLERKNGGKIFLCLQDGKSRVRMHRLHLQSCIDIRKVLST